MIHSGKQKVLVYGATGSQQSPVVYQLLSKGHQPYAVTHNLQRAAALGEAGARITEADMADRERLFTISRGMDAVALLIPFFVANPLDGLTYAKNAIDAAKEANVGLVVWNSSGFILPHRIGNPAMDVRIDIAEYLSQSGLPYVIIQPSAYTENLLGPWTAPFVANRNQLAYPTPTVMPVGWIATQDVASLVVAALGRPHLAGSSFPVSGIENLTGPQLAAHFSTALGRQIDYYPMPPAEFGRILDELFGEGAGKGAEEAYQSMWDSSHYPPMHVDMRPVLEALPVEMTPIQAWVKKNAAAFC